MINSFVFPEVYYQNSCLGIEIPVKPKKPPAPNVIKLSDIQQQVGGAFSRDRDKIKRKSRLKSLLPILIFFNLMTLPQHPLSQEIYIGYDEKQSVAFSEARGENNHSFCVKFQAFLLPVIRF